MLIYARDVRQGGRTDVLSRPRLQVSFSIALHISSLLPGCSAEPLSTGAAGRVFPAATAYNFKSTAVALFCCFLLSSSCASMVWTDTAFGASGCSRTGLCGLVATHFGCPHCVSVSWVIFQPTNKGRSGLRFQRNLELAFSNLSAPAVP